MNDFDLHYRHNKVVNEAGETEKAGCIVVNNADEILIVTNDSSGQWGLPKGHAEFGETSEQVAIRETLEETGCKVELVEHLGDLTYISGESGDPIRVHYYLAKPVEQIGMAEEQWAWKPLAEVKTLVRPNVAQFLEVHRGRIQKRD